MDNTLGATTILSIAAKEEERERREGEERGRGKMEGKEQREGKDGEK